MNLQQLEYIIAVDTHRHFATAAQKSFVTQPTLSMMIQKLEEELDVKIFDRSKHPVVPTKIGEEIIAQARKTVWEAKRIKELVSQNKKQVNGELKLGIIPTVAPYLLPLFLVQFIKKYPDVKLKISELTTEQIVEKLSTGNLDAGILATPLHIPDISESKLYYERLMVYGGSQSGLAKKKYILAKDIDVNKLWLLEEGHCLRSQALNLCELRDNSLLNKQLVYEAGTIETLIKMTEVNNGITIIPELAAEQLPAKKQKHVLHFKSPEPVREISIVTYRHFVKESLLDVLKKEITAVLPQPLKENKKVKVTELV